MTTAKPVAPNAVLSADTDTRPDFRWKPYVHPVHNPANWLTFAGFVSGAGALGLAQHRLLFWTVMSMMFSTVMDLADGTIARLTGTVDLPYKFGHVLDFAADLVWAVGGGAAMMYYGQLHSLHLAGVAVALIWCVCGMARLARYTVMGHSDDGYYIGCPAPLAADIMIIAIMINTYVVKFSALITAGLAVALSVAMVSWFQLPNWATCGANISNRVVSWEIGRRFNELLSSTTSGGDGA
jgi:phosphatidylserine synthase